MLNAVGFRLLNCGWSEEELRTAGGDAGVVVHPLKLNSSYAKINVRFLDLFLYE